MDHSRWASFRWVGVLVAAITWGCSDGDDCADTTSHGRWRLDQAGASGGGAGNLGAGGTSAKGGAPPQSC